MFRQGKISLRKIWVLLVLLSVVMPLTITMVWYGYHHYKYELEHSLLVERQANEQLKYQVESEVKRLVTLLKNKSDPISFLIDKADNPDNLKEIYKLLGFIDSRERSVSGLMVLSKQGGLLAAIDSQMDVISDYILSAEELEFMKEHWGFDAEFKYPELVIPMAGRVYIGLPKNHEGYFAINIAVPIGGSPRGVLIAEIDIAKLWNISTFTERGLAQERTRKYILNSRGTLLTSIDDSDYEPGDLMTHFPIVRAALINDEWSSEDSYTGITGKRVFGTLTRIPLLDWTLISEVAVYKITSDIWRSLRNIFYFNIFIIIASILIALLLIKKTSTPIKQACIAINNVADGDYSHSLKTCGIRELDAMAIGFNEMASARQSAEELKERVIHDLKTAINEVKVLKGLIPICATCKKIRDDSGYWNQVESYISKHSEAEFTHAYCPDCREQVLKEVEEMKRIK